MKKSFFMTALLAISFLTGCVPEPKTLDSATNPSLEASVDNAVLYIQMSARWEGDTAGDFENFGNCTIPSQTPTGNQKSCTFSMPEGQMYFSDIKFTVGTANPETCTMIQFKPYYYKRSNSNTFTPPRATSSVDCSTDPKKECFGGAATHLVPEFPKNTFLYYLPFSGIPAFFNLPSENTRRWYNTPVNYSVTNDLVARGNTVANGSSRSYVAGSMVDYEVNCTNYWGDTLYQIKLIVNDDDLPNDDNDPSDPNSDSMEDWD